MLDSNGERLKIIFMIKMEVIFMAKSKIVKVTDKIAEDVTAGYKKMEESVVSGYKKMEEGAVGGFTKLSDGFIDHFLTKEGESVEDAKKRIAEEHTSREATTKAERQTRETKQKERVAASKERAKYADKHM